MIVVALIGILGALAFPAYLDYSIRAKVSELVLQASAFKVRVSERAHDQGALSSAGVGLTITPSGKVSGGSITDGGIVTVSGSSATIGTDVTVVLTPNLASDGKVVWTCSADPARCKYVPAECRN